LLLAVSIEPQEIGQRLRGARERKGWTQMQFANEAHVSLSSIQRWERGSLPPIRELIRLAGVLDVDPEQLVEVEPTSDDQIADLREEVAELRGYAVRILRVLGEEADSSAPLAERASSRRPA